MAIKSKSKWKTQFYFIEGNSQFHEEVRQLLRTHEVFKRMRCYQEVPVADLCPDYYDNSHRIDWFIEDLGTILELHGIQHYKMTNRGNIAYEQAEREFRRGLARDIAKKTALEEEGYKYVVIPYKEYGKLNFKRLEKYLLS